MNRGVSREVRRVLEEYQQLLFKWSDAFNLISNNQRSNFWNSHIMDSMQLLNYIEDYNLSVVDVGAGNGLPGLVLSICGVKNVTLIESNEKKCAFLLQATRLSNNKVNIINDRVESVNASYDILVSKGFANLDKMFDYTKSLLVRKKYILLKGEKYYADIVNAKMRWKFGCNVYDSMTSDNGKVLEITNLSLI